MAGTEEQALDFLVGLGVDNFDKGVDKVVEGLDEIAAAAEAAHEATKNEKGESVADSIVPKDTAKRSPLQLKLIAGATKVATFALNGLKKVVREGVDDWKNNYLSLIQYRREVGLTSRDIFELNDEVVRATAKYGFSLKDAYTQIRLLGQGAATTKRDLADMIGQIGEVSRYTGVSTDALAELAFILTKTENTLGKTILDPDKFRNFSYSLQFALKESKVPLKDFVQQLISNKKILDLYRPSAMKLIPQLAALRAAWADTSQPAEAFDEILSALSDDTGALTGQFLSAKESVTGLLTRLKGLAQRYDNTKLAVAGLSKQFGISIAAMRGLLATTSKIKEIEKYEGRFGSAFARSAKDNLKILRENATLVERLRFAWEDIRNSVSIVSGELFKWTKTNILPKIVDAAETVANLARYGPLGKTTQTAKETIESGDFVPTKGRFKFDAPGSIGEFIERLFKGGRSISPNQKFITPEQILQRGRNKLVPPSAAPSTTEGTETSMVPSLGRIEAILDGFAKRMNREDARYRGPASGGNQLASSIIPELSRRGYV